jgi:integrase
MASISHDPGGQRRILFKAPDGIRKTIRLGKVQQKVAECVKTKVEHLLASKITSHPLDDETSRWVANLDTILADKLAKVGLIPAREKSTLGEYLDNYIACRSDVKGGTLLTYRQGRETLVEFFGADKVLRDISPGDCEEWGRWLRTKGYADATVSRRIKHAKTFFAAAVRKRLILENPFVVLKAGNQENKTRLYFVTHEEARQVLDACPDAQWRLIFALSRFGGLRCPSEHLALRWSNVDWEQGRITVPSPKTEHHSGGGSRIIPIFPELRPYLEEVREQAEPGTEWIITKYRTRNINLRTRLEKIIYRAGLIPWPRLFQNLRSSRETELTTSFPLHVVTAWIGNSERVASKHYLQVTEDHFKTAQKAAQYPADYVVPASKANRNRGIFPDKYRSLRSNTMVVVGPEGFEPPTKGL